MSLCLSEDLSETWHEELTRLYVKCKNVKMEIEAKRLEGRLCELNSVCLKWKRERQCQWTGWSVHTETCSVFQGPPLQYRGKGACNGNAHILYQNVFYVFYSTFIFGKKGLWWWVAASQVIVLVKRGRMYITIWLLGHLLQRAIPSDLHLVGPLFVCFYVYKRKEWCIRWHKLHDHLIKVQL